MVAFRIGELRYASLDDSAFGMVLEAAALAGGAAQFPILFSLTNTGEAIGPLAIVDELARLGATPEGGRAAMLIAVLRDDLMEALATAEEG